MFDDYDDSDYHFNAHYDFIAILREEHRDDCNEEYEQGRDGEMMVPYLKGTNYIICGCREIDSFPF